MRILLINSCHYRRGGADVVYLNSIDLLLSKGHEVIAFSQDNLSNLSVHSSDFFVKSFEIYKLSFIGKLINAPKVIYSLEAARNLQLLINQQRPDVAHIHLYKGVLTVSILQVLKKNKIPAVITLHDFGLLCPRSVFLDGKKQLCEKCLTSSTLNCIVNRCNRGSFIFSTMTFLEYNFSKYLFSADKYFNKLICVSRFNFEKHKAYTGLAAKLVHLYNFFPSKVASQLTSRGPYFLYFGRLTEGKGLETLFDAFKEIGNSVNLVVVGIGEMEKTLREKIATEHISNISMLGFKEGEVMKEIIDGSSFIIVPSIFYENNPMVIVEGYAYGKPVIGSRRGGIEEVVIEGKTGFTFEPGNVNDLSGVISKAAELSDAEYYDMSSEAQLFATTHFNKEHHYQTLHNVYSSLVK